MGILGAIQMIMVGNSYGIAMSAFKSRLKGEIIESSSLWYEIRMLLSIIPFIPMALIQALIENAFHIPLLSFKNNQIGSTTAANN